MSKDTEIIHELIKPFKYTPKNSGEETDAQFISLQEPSVQQLASCSTLKQAFMRVISKESSGEETSTADTDSSAADDVPMENRIINALYASDEDMPRLLATAKELFRSVGMVDGEKKLTLPMLDSLCMEDLEMMTGKYLANFILVSVLKDQ